AMPHAGPGTLPLRPLERLQCEIDGAVTDGVRRDAPTPAMRREDAIPQHFGVITQHPDTAVAFERLRDGGGLAAQRPVGEDLHRPDAQEVVTEATAHAEIETHQLVGE